MNTPRFTILYKKSGRHYYHYGLQNGIIDQLKLLNIKCIAEGDYKNRRMLFLDQNCPLRTDELFKLRKNPEHHTEISIFEKIPLPMVTTFPLDFHLICICYALHIGLQNRNPVIIGKEFKNYFSLEFYSCNSQDMNIFVIDNNLTELKCFSVNKIVKKAVLFPYKKDQFCIFPLLHSDLMPVFSCTTIMD
ncbi:hypothetical protein ACFW04_013839 [Cataglyphis niger]